MHKLKYLAIAGAVLALAAVPVAAQDSARPVGLGMAIDHMMEGTDGGEVTAILPDRNGAALGFKVGDILIEVGGKPISREVLQAYMKDRKPGDLLSFKVKRAGAVLELAGPAVATPEGAPPAAELLKALQEAEE